MFRSYKWTFFRIFHYQNSRHILYFLLSSFELRTQHITVS